MKSTTKYRPATRSRYAYQAILDRIGDLSYEHARMIAARLDRHLNTVSLTEESHAVVSAAQPPPAPRVNYQQEFTRCGKKTCQPCAAGPGHGPYWYAYWSAHGKTKKRYIGKNLPPADAAARALALGHPPEPGP